MITAYKINAFAKTSEGGNPAGIVIDANTLSEADMIKIARTLGFSETAFVLESETADFKIRFFTPKEEVDLCGHATVGTFSTLLQKNIIIPGNYTQETKAGILGVEVKEDAIIMMNQKRPVFYDILNAKEIATSLNIPVDHINTDLPVQIVSTGIRDIMVPIRSMDMLDCIKPDFNQVTEISRKYNVIGYHMFTMESLYHSTAYCRNLAPLYNIPEEAATGTSNGALACYLYKNGVVSSEGCRSMIFEQGYSMKLPSEILASLSIEDNEIIEVRVGGKALGLSKIALE
jgi:PhzF family phenazine biosynthesis protein